MDPDDDSPRDINFLDKLETEQNFFIERAKLLLQDEDLLQKYDKNDEYKNLKNFKFDELIPVLRENHELALIKIPNEDRLNELKMTMDEYILDAILICSTLFPDKLMPEDMPQDMPENIPEDMPQDMPKDMPQDMPEDILLSTGDNYNKINKKFKKTNKRNKRNKTKKSKSKKNITKKNIKRKTSRMYKNTKPIETL